LGVFQQPEKTLLFPAEIITQTLAVVLIVVAVNAEILPVGAVGGVILGIAILMMHRQELPVAVIELSAAFGANHPVDFQRALAVVHALGCHVPVLGDYLTIKNQKPGNRPLFLK
jgi:hypothetical protein